jgi:putative SOS response-associated peptidase YedK
MCGRYASFFPAEFIARRFATANPLPNLDPTWNMAPTMEAPVVRLIDGDRHLDALKWGLIPLFHQDVKKARKPINARDANVANFGGMWETRQSPEGELLQTFATMTTGANRQLAGIQQRMPVIIERKDWSRWLGETDGDPSALLRAAPEDVLRIWPVWKAVGNFRNDGPQLLEPTAVAEPTLL